MVKHYEFQNPYDFVPLEEAIDRGYEAQPQDRISPDLLTGTIRCQLETETPLFIHGVGQQNGPIRGFYSDGDGPLIPATSLKGAIRSIAEIVGNCCLSTLPADLVYSQFGFDEKGRGPWTRKANSHYRTYTLRRFRDKGLTTSKKEFRRIHRAISLGGRLGHQVHNMKTDEVDEAEKGDAYRPCVHRGHKCLCCALFGMVEEGREEGTAAPLAGRVYFEAARPVSGGAGRRRIACPEPGGGPHPHHRLFYFEDGGRRQILGRKLYYHHRDWQESCRRSIRLSNRAPLQLDAYEGSFEFTVRFENLTQQELGVLLFALELQPDLRHHLGFGKPFGLGTVRITVQALRLLHWGSDSGAAGPSRYLHYHLEGLPEEQLWDTVLLGDGSRVEQWKATILDAWENRSGGAVARQKFSRILRWPTDQSYQYPHFFWFRETQDAKTMGLEAYQKRARGEEPPDSDTSKPPTDPTGRQRGTVKWFSEEKGYGFISRPGDEDIFVHYSDIRGDGYRKLEQNQTVAFDVERGPKGPRAVDVVVIEEGDR
jgi:CspA family cold shock protein